MLGVQKCVGSSGMGQSWTGGRIPSFADGFLHLSLSVTGKVDTGDFTC